MLIHKSTLLLGLALAPVYAALAVAQASTPFVSEVLCSCGRVHSGPCSAAASPSLSSEASAATPIGFHAVSINQAEDGSLLPLPEGHYYGDGHNHGPIAAANGTVSPTLQIVTRWSFTATDGFVGFAQGTPANLTWGIARDGTPINGFGGVTASSDLVAFLDETVGVPGDASLVDLEQRSWFPVLASAYERWGEISGLTFEYEANDDGVPIATAGGVLGVRADLRISGASVDGEMGPNVLAFNAFPNNGDGVIDTDNEGFFGIGFDDFRPLRNVLAHEIGHGLGLAHVVSDNADFLLEPFINLGFDGPQLNDLLAAQRTYGDALESNGGNDSVAAATELGVFQVGGAFAIGTDADSTASGTIIADTETDFVSIDGQFDDDFYSFSVSEPTVLDAVLTQVGAVFTQADEAPADAPPLPQVELDTRSLASLELELLEIDQTGAETSLGVTGTSVGFAESLDDLVLLPGVEYAVAVRPEFGSEDNVQLYRLDLVFSAVAVPEPSTLLMLLTAAGAWRSRRRSA